MHGGKKRQMSQKPILNTVKYRDTEFWSYWPALSASENKGIYLNVHSTFIIQDH